ncbi:MAG: hypothetical protein Q4Q31_12485 [Bacillota bacterium]|nr:hypothetical protein [Bacillota bacterium]
MSDKTKNEIIKSTLEVSYLPNLDFKKNKKHTKISLSDISLLGGAFSSITPFFRTVNQTFNYDLSNEIAGQEGLYRLFFNGKQGQLAKAKDGNGFIGTIVNNGIVGQSRLQKVESIPVECNMTLPINPMFIATAVALKSIDMKLDSIKEKQEEILDFLNADKESKLIADLEILGDVLNNYKYNFENEKFINSKLDLVQNINRNSLSNIKFYKSQINELLNNNDPIHLNFNNEDKISKVQSKFIYYKLANYLYAYSSFIEVLLLKSFNSNFLKKVINKIQESSNEYRLFYTECYNALENYSNNSIENQFLKGLSSFSKDTGKVISNIPFLGDFQLDEALTDFGKNISKEKKKSTKKVMKKLTSNKDSDLSLFISNLKNIDQIYNHPLEIYYDAENIYLPNKGLK